MVGTGRSPHMLELECSIVRLPRQDKTCVLREWRTDSYVQQKDSRGPAQPEAGAAPAAVAEAKAAWQREKLPGELPRSPTIPFQPKVANTVRLVGNVAAPLHMQQTPDGRFYAVSVLVQDRRLDIPKFWVPIVFQDDLAQVLAHGLQFVDSKVVETGAILDEEEGCMEVVKAEKKLEEKRVTSKYPPSAGSGYKNKWDKFSNLWNDVITRPQDWIDNRPQKKDGSRSARYPDFKNKVSGEALWLDSAPPTVLDKLDGMVFGTGHGEDKAFSSYTQKGTVANWSKFRKSPDASALSKQKPEEEELWRDLLDNPVNWWDNRTDKRTPKSPDFKHKESGEALWIGSKSPQWAVDALPSLKFKGGSNSKGTRRQETLLSGEPLPVLCTTPLLNIEVASV
nr:unnamed protein product [Digitaria exilis]